MSKFYPDPVERREDLTIYAEDVVAVGAGDTELIAAVANKKIKIYAAGYESDGAVDVGFRFESGSKFCRRVTAGPYAQSFIAPMVGGFNEALNLRAEAAVNVYVWVQYIQEG